MRRGDREHAPAGDQVLLDPVPQRVFAASRAGDAQSSPAAPGRLQGEADGAGEVRQRVPVARVELPELPRRIGEAPGREVRGHGPAVLHEPVPLVPGEHGVEGFGHPGPDERVRLAVVVHEDHRPGVEVEPDQGAVLGLGAPDRIPVVVVVRREAPGGAVFDRVRVRIAVRPAGGRLEPGREPLVAVRVRGGNDVHHEVLEQFVVPAGQEFPRHPERRLEGGGLVAVVPVVQEDPGGGARDDRFGCVRREPARIGEPPGVALDLLQPGEIVGRADGQQDQLPVLEGLAEGGDPEPGGLLDGVEVAVEPAVVGDGASHRETDDVFRRRNLGEPGRRQGEQAEQTPVRRETDTQETDYSGQPANAGRTLRFTPVSVAFPVRRGTVQRNPNEGASPCQKECG